MSEDAQFLAKADQWALHIIVNNAGFTWDNMIHKMSDEQWDGFILQELRYTFNTQMRKVGVTGP